MVDVVVGLRAGEGRTMGMMSNPAEAVWWPWLCAGDGMVEVLAVEGWISGETEYELAESIWMFAEGCQQGEVGVSSRLAALRSLTQLSR